MLESLGGNLARDRIRSGRVGIRVEYPEPVGNLIAYDADTEFDSSTREVTVIRDRFVNLKTGGEVFGHGLQIADGRKGWHGDPVSGWGIYFKVTHSRLPIPVEAIHVLLEMRTADTVDESKVTVHTPGSNDGVGWALRWAWMAVVR